MADTCTAEPSAAPQSVDYHFLVVCASYPEIRCLVCVVSASTFPSGSTRICLSIWGKSFGCDSRAALGAKKHITSRIDLKCMEL